MRLCGYSADRPLAEVWENLLLGPNSPPPTQVQGEHEFGIRWDGEYEALSRLIFGLGTGFEDAAKAACRSGPAIGHIGLGGTHGCAV